MFCDDLFQSLQQFLTQFVPGYIAVKTFHFFNKQKSSSFEGTAVASIVISYVINLVVGLLVKPDGSNLLLSEIIAVAVAIIGAICVVKVKTLDRFKTVLQRVGRVSNNDNIWKELFDVNRGAAIRCYTKFNNEIAMINGVVRAYNVRDDGECDIVLTKYTVTYFNESKKPYDLSQLDPSNCPDLYLNSKNIHGLEVLRGEN